MSTPEDRIPLRLLKRQVFEAYGGKCKDCDRELMFPFLIQEAGRTVVGKDEREGIITWYAGDELKTAGIATVDHLIPVADGGPDAFDNLELCCIPCHRRRTNRLHCQQREERRLAQRLKADAGNPSAAVAAARRAIRQLTQLLKNHSAKVNKGTAAYSVTRVEKRLRALPEGSIPDDLREELRYTLAQIRLALNLPSVE